VNTGHFRAPSRPNIARATRRSRAVRAAFERRRKRSIALAALASLAFGVPIAWSISAPTGDMVQAAVDQAKSLADLLSERSPGSRTQGELTKTKRARAAAKLHTAPKSAARAIAPKPTVPAELAAIVASPPLLPVGDLAFAAPFQIDAPPSLGAILASSPGIPGATPPGENGGGPISFPSSEPREAVTSAVPEPATWVMMLLGFGLVGWRVRRRDRRSCANLPA
jgi:hypothetical protein